jgi:DNA repair protein RecO (recombination protein O)
VAVYRCEAVILRKLNFGEADRIMTLFTLERGKLAAIAKSVRKARSRMSGHLDVFAHGSMMLAEGRNLDVITQFRRLTETEPLGRDLEKSAAAAVVIEVADKVLEERHPQPVLFHIVIDALARMSAPAAGPRAELADYLMRVLGELGYMPELYTCARCGRALEPEGEMAFSPLFGGVICSDCNDPIAPAAPIGARTVKILRVLASGDRDTFLRLKLDADDIRAVEHVLEGQLEHHLDRQLKSIDFVRNLESMETSERRS